MEEARLVMVQPAGEAALKLWTQSGVQQVGSWILGWATCQRLQHQDRPGPYALSKPCPDAALPKALLVIDHSTGLSFLCFLLESVRKSSIAEEEEVGEP